jgi:uncharacterized RDD family membrane protein YckC
MEQILDLPNTGTRTLNYAGFWIRFVAYLIDTVVIYAVLFAVAAIFGVGSGAFTDPSAVDMSSMALIYVVFFLGIIGYFIGMESSAKQATLGKMAVGIKVGDELGNRISVGKAAGRFFGKIISGLILYIGYMMAGWDPKKQALHDKLAGTFVFYGK